MMDTIYIVSTLAVLLSTLLSTSLACDTDVNVTMSFGGKSWSISNDDFQLTQISQSECVGAFFELTTGNSAPAWIVGDTFLV